MTSMTNITLNHQLSHMRNKKGGWYLQAFTNCTTSATGVGKSFLNNGVESAMLFAREGVLHKTAPLFTVTIYNTCTT